MNFKTIKNIFIAFTLIVLSIALLCPKNTLMVEAGFTTDTNSKSYVLLEYDSEKVLVDKNADEKLPIASVTKLMTILLTLEEIENQKTNLTDRIVVSENASGMGGSQIFLDANCEYEIGQLLKSVIVASANDSSVALAEHIAGSEQNFVKLMNEKAQELNMTNTHYSNCTGLPSADGYSSAFDQAIVLKQVLSHDLYHEYSSIWMEDFLHPSGRITQMTNTNKLSRFYEGCTGGKTGSTNQAKYCLAVGAERNESKFIAVVLGAENSKERFKLASDLLNYGFENFESKLLFSDSDLINHSINIKGTDQQIKLKAEQEFSIVLERGANANFNLDFHLPTTVKSVKENDILGVVDIYVDGVKVDTINILSASTYQEPTIWEYFKDIIAN